MTANDISVVLCTYNGERFVRRQLTSIIEQTTAPAEIVVSDDGSTDATLRVVESVAAGTDIPIHVHRNPAQLGFGENFLQACNRATSRHIAFSDQDDDWYPDKLAVARRALDDHGAVLAVHPVELIDSRGAPLRPPDRASKNDLKRTSPLVMEQFHAAPWANFLGFTMLFDRSLLDRIPAGRRGLDPYIRGAMLSHDRWVYFLATTFGRTVVLEQALARYRQHNSQLFGGTKPRTLAERLRGKMRDGREQAEYLAGIAAYRADLLASSHSGPDGDDAVAVWRCLEAHLRARSAIYEKASVVARLRHVGHLAGDGAYRGPADGGLGRGALVEDLAVAVARSLNPERTTARVR